jgi:hypothetical protein
VAMSKPVTMGGKVWIKCETCGQLVKEKEAIYDGPNDLYSCSQECKDRYHKGEK